MQYLELRKRQWRFEIEPDVRPHTMRVKQLQPWVGLPNILCREFVVPELLQDAATPQALASALLRWVDAKSSAPDKIAAVQERFTRLHAELRRDTSRLATDAIQKIIQA